MVYKTGNRLKNHQRLPVISLYYSAQSAACADAGILFRL